MVSRSFFLSLILCLLTERDFETQKGEEGVGGGSERGKGRETERGGREEWRELGREGELVGWLVA